MSIVKFIYVALLASIGAGGFYSGHTHGKATFNAIARFVVPESMLEDMSRFVRQSKTNKKVLVFVHGVTGTPRSTWTNTNNGHSVYWPDLVKADERFKEYDIFVMSYYSPQLKTGPSIYQLADALYKDLEDNNIYPDQNGQSQYEEVIFICHSMANLLVRTSMITRPLPKNSTQQISLILSIASPSEGSSLADFADRFSDNPAFKEMVKGETNSFLQLLNSQWRLSAFDTEIACAYELRANASLSKRVVEKDSATAVCTRPDPRGIDEDHISIVKPGGRDHAIHSWLFEETIQRPKAQRGWELDRWTRNEIIVGGKDFAESNIHAAMIALTLESALPNLKVIRRYSMGHAGRLHSSLRDRLIDIYPEYDGSLLYEYLRKNLPGEDGAAESAAVFDSDTVTRELQKNSQTTSMVYFPNFGFHNPYVMVMLRSKAQELGLVGKDGKVTISDLEYLGSGKLIVQADQEFSFRKDGWAGLKQKYQFLKAVKYEYLEHAKIYGRLRANQSEGFTIVGVGFGTDYELNFSPDWVKLEDDRKFFPYYHPAPLVDRLLLKKFPDVAPALKKLANIMTTEEMSVLLEAQKKLEAESSLLDEEKRRELMEGMVRGFLQSKKVLPAG